MLVLREEKGSNHCNPDYEAGPPDVPRRRHLHSAVRRTQTLLRSSVTEERGHISRKIRRGPTPSLLLDWPSDPCCLP